MSEISKIFTIEARSKDEIVFRTDKDMTTFYDLLSNAQNVIITYDDPSNPEYLISELIDAGFKSKISAGAVEIKAREKKKNP